MKLDLRLCCDCFCVWLNLTSCHEALLLKDVLISPSWSCEMNLGGDVMRTSITCCRRRGDAPAASSVHVMIWTLQRRRLGSDLLCLLRRKRFLSYTLFTLQFCFLQTALWVLLMKLFPFISSHQLPLLSAPQCGDLLTGRKPGVLHKVLEKDEMEQDEMD